MAYANPQKWSLAWQQANEQVNATRLEQALLKIQLEQNFNCVVVKNYKFIIQKHLKTIKMKNIKQLMLLILKKSNTQTFMYLH